MGKLFILFNTIPTFLIALGLFTYYKEVDGSCSRYPDVYPKLCPVLGRIGHSAKKSKMTALKIGGKFQEGVNFRYAVHSNFTAAMHH